MHPHHIRMALHMLGCDPQESPSLEDQLAAAAQSVGRDLTFYRTAESTIDRGYCLGSIGTALLPHSEAYGHDYAFGHALGRASRELLAPPPGRRVARAKHATDSAPLTALMVIPRQSDETVRRLRVPVVFGRGADTVQIPFGQAIEVVEPCIERPDGNRYMLFCWGGMLGLLGEPERRLEPLDTLVRDVDRWELLRGVFEGADPGVWGDDKDIVDLVQKDVATATARDVKTARTRYRRGDLCEEPLGWVVARIDALAVWKKVNGETFEERWDKLPEETQGVCKRPEGDEA